MVASVIPGVGSPQNIERTLKLFNTRIPNELWHDLKNDGLLHADTPVPSEAATAGHLT
jgi:D-threo-aldose 1-dehydrogenase